MEEIWKGIEVFGFNSETGIATFEVSNMGHVRKAGYYDDAMRYHEPEMLTIYLDKRGNRCFVRLRIGLNRQVFSVHKLVAEAFVKRPFGTKFVKWRDGNIKNNRADNLYWTVREKPRSGTGGNKGKAVRVYSDKFELLGEFDSCADAGRQLRVSGGGVADCCRGKTPKYLGLIWQFVESDKYYKSGMTPSCDVTELIELCSTRESGSPRCPIRQYSISGDFLGEYKSLEEVIAKNNTWQISVMLCCRREYATGYGYVWRYAVDDELANLSKSDRYLLIKRILQEYGHNVVRQYSFDGSLVKEYSNITEASGGDKIRVQKISAVCKRIKDAEYAYGFVWRYENADELFALSVEQRAKLIAELAEQDWRHVRQYTKDGKLVHEYKSLHSAARKIGGGVSTLSRVCNRQKSYSSAYGFIWRWADDDEFASEEPTVK